MNSNVLKISRNLRIYESKNLAYLVATRYDEQTSKKNKRIRSNAIIIWRNVFFCNHSDGWLTRLVNRTNNNIGSWSVSRKKRTACNLQTAPRQGDMVIAWQLLPWHRDSSSGTIWRETAMVRRSFKVKDNIYSISASWLEYWQTISKVDNTKGVGSWIIWENYSGTIQEDIQCWW